MLTLSLGTPGLGLESGQLEDLRPYELLPTSESVPVVEELTYLHRG